jgi:DNA-binding transcriptional regulator YhcF (GntR family)/predicted GIY-YIG superfamily endonuclease
MLLAIATGDADAELPVGNRYAQQALDRLPADQQERARIRRRRHCVYRHYDDESTLLYVGISVAPDVRAAEHATNEWARFAARMDGVWFDTWAAAKAAEQEAIRVEEPIFNIVGRGCRVERNERVARYVAARTSPAEADQMLRHRIDWSPSATQRITDHYRGEIREERLKPGAPLPANRRLAAEWGVSTRTALRAVQVLAEEGWITTRPGKPPVVLGDPAAQRPDREESQP